MFKQNLLLFLLCALACSQLLSPTLSTAPQFSYCSSSSTDQCCDGNTIEVQGDVTLQVDPDQASLSIQLTANGKTTSEAVNALSLLMNTVIGILKANGLSEENYSTSNFNVYPNTTWNNGVSTVIGQIASQSLLLDIPSVDGPKISKIIDDLATVNGIILNSLSFDIQNKTLAFQQARNQAFQMAQSKAKDYAEALYLKLGKVVNLKDFYNSAPVVIDGSQLSDIKMSAVAGSSSTNIQVGKIPVSYNMGVIFSFEWCCDDDTYLS